MVTAEVEQEKEEPTINKETYTDDEEDKEGGMVAGQSRSFLRQVILDIINLDIFCVQKYFH